VEDIDGISELFTFGFTLGDKTISTEHKMPDVSEPYEIYDRETSWKDVYKALEDSVIRTCQEHRNIGFLLSGGADSRVIAGIVIKNGFDIPFYTVNLFKKEVESATKLAEILKVRHSIVSPVEDRNLLSYDKLKEVALHSKGTLSMPHYVMRRKEGIEDVDAFIGGHYGTELWCDSAIRWGIGAKDFTEQYYANRLRIKSLYIDYHERAYVNMLNYCKGLDNRTLIYETYVKTRIKTEPLFGVPTLLPVLSSGVLSTTFSLPIDMRVDKKVNHLIIKNIFPELSTVPDVLVKKGSRYRHERRIRKFLGLPRQDTVDFNHMFRSNKKLGGYAREGVPSISEKDICENVIDAFYDKKANVCRALSCFLTYHFLKQEWDL